MILYRRIDDEQDHPASSNSLWLDVSQKASKLIMVFFILGFFFGALQWYQYSGQWYLFGYNREEFLQVSTGIDWNIAWVADNRTGINGFITFAYILICWLYYSIGWCFIFAMYGLLFKVIDRIQEMTNSGVFKGQAAIVADKEDEQYAGFRNLISIQKQHYFFCIACALTFFFMALRNAYLPHECREFDMAIDDEFAHCTSFVSMILIGPNLLIDWIAGEISIESFLRGVFFQYAAQNTFTLGSMAHVALLLAFFVYVSHKLQLIFENALENTETDNRSLGKTFRNELRRYQTSAFFILGLSIAACLFVNLGSVLLFVILLLQLEAILSKIKAYFFPKVDD
jgi:hypothetical protein